MFICLFLIPTTTLNGVLISFLYVPKEICVWDKTTLPQDNYLTFDMSSIIIIRSKVFYDSKILHQKFFIVSTISEISNPDKRELFDMIEDGSRLPPINCVYKIICMRQTITMTRLFLRNYKNSMIICMRQIILKLAKRYEHPNKQCIINE